MAERPNFLLFITDQQRADHLGCYGNTVNQTPNIDAIAARGTRFERCYVACPVCMPNRASLMTGRMPSAHGVRHNGIPLSLGATTFVSLLRAAGYRTALLGKSHLQNFEGLAPEIVWHNPGTGEPPPTRLIDADLDRRIGPDYDNEWTPHWIDRPDHDVILPYYDFEHVRLCTLHGDHVHGHYGRWLAQQHADPDGLRGPQNAIPDDRYGAPQAWRTRMPEELYPTSYVADRTIDYLDAHAAGGADAPFFIQCSFPDPHHPYTPPGRYWDMYDPAEIELPASFRVNREPPPVAYVREHQRAEAERSPYAPFVTSEREAREIIALTYGMMTMIDDAVGRVITRVDQLGLAANTVILFTSDHGDWMGDHGIMLKGPLHYQGLIRVPLVWADPDLPAEIARPAGPGNGGRVRSLASTIDIPATILARAGLAPYNGLQGSSLLDMVAGAADGVPGRAGLLVEEDALRPNFGFAERPRVRTLITERHRLSYWGGSAWGELYDLVDDPHELDNKWDNPAAGQLKTDLTRQLLDEMIAMQSRSPLPSGLA